MALEIRPISADEVEEFRQVLYSSFVGITDLLWNSPPEFTLCVVKDSAIATTSIMYPVCMCLEGNDVPVVAVGAVATHPVYRRRGYISKLITRHFEYIHEQGERPLVVLWAASAALYRRYGYATVTTRHAYSVDPKCLEFGANKLTAHSVREMKDGEFCLMEKLYGNFKKKRTGYLHRTPVLWERNILAPDSGGNVLSKIAYEEEGRPLGYLVYSIETNNLPEHRQRNLTVHDLVWLNPSAYQAIWRYLSGMDHVDNIIWNNVPSDDPLPYLLLEPNMLNATLSDGIMARIIDVEQVFKLRSYPEEGTLSFEVVDDLCTWNCGSWQLEASASGASICRTDASPQLRIPISTLAMIVFNRISATEASRMGRLDVFEHDALPVWDALMHTSYRPFCADHF